MKKEKGVYAEVWKYLKESKIYFLIAGIIFLCAILIGYVFPVFFSEIILNFIKNIINQTQGFGFWQLFVFIIQNNVMSAFIGMLAGIFLGIFPALNAAMNGYVLGFVMNKTSEAAGSSILLRLLPHGIFEIPALIISLGLGIRLGMFLFAKNRGKDLKYNLENSLRVFLFVVIPLLIIAGFIEVGLIVLLG